MEHRDSAKLVAHAESAHLLGEAKRVIGSLIGGVQRRIAADARTSLPWWLALAAGRTRCGIYDGR